ncbi:MAG TPA: hypothetical protein VN376_07290, partial [Longilinea sp.]|nr:hypothetical protein [Longilinea sp.]
TTPVCDEGVPLNLNAISPQYYETLVSLSPPLIQWSFVTDTGSPATCHPANQHIRFGTRTFATDGTIILTTLEETDLAGTAASWTPSSALLPAGHYFWEVTPISSSGTAGFARVIPFVTGPICTVAELLPPTILSVPDGASVPAGSILSWDFQGGCVPTGVEIDMSTTSSFEPTNSSFCTYPVAMHAALVDVNDFLLPCHTYYWRVAALIEDRHNALSPDSSSPVIATVAPETIEVESWIHSGYSEVRSFYFMDNTCPNAPATPTVQPTFTPTATQTITASPTVRLIAPTVTVEQPAQVDCSGLNFADCNANINSCFWNNSQQCENRP